jgi:hypothetical protein
MMAVLYLILIGYFRSIGGYSPVYIEPAAAGADL